MISCRNARTILWLGWSRPGDGELPRARLSGSAEDGERGRVEARARSREPAERAVAAETRELAVDAATSRPVAAAHEHDEPLAVLDPADDRAEQAALALDEAAGLERRNERGVAGAGAQDASETVGAGDGSGGRGDGPALRAATRPPRSRARRRGGPAQVGERAGGERGRGAMTTAMSVVRYGRSTRRRAAAAARADPAERRGATRTRSRRAGAARTARRRSRRPAAEAPGEDPRELDLEAAREDDLPAPDDARLQPRVARVRATTSERGGAGTARPAVGVVSAPHDRGHEPQPDEQRDRERGRAELPHARSQRTSTGVPCVANAYISGASRAIIRTQPCEAGYVGTGQYSWIAIPPVK